MWHRQFLNTFGRTGVASSVGGGSKASEKRLAAHAKQVAQLVAAKLVGCRAHRRWCRQKLDMFPPHTKDDHWNLCSCTVTQVPTPKLSHAGPCPRICLQITVCAPRGENRPEQPTAAARDDTMPCATRTTTGSFDNFFWWQLRMPENRKMLGSKGPGLRYRQRVWRTKAGIPALQQCDPPSTLPQLERPVLVQRRAANGMP
jgi:hypothetical protein